MKNKAEENTKCFIDQLPLVQVQQDTNIDPKS